MKLLAILPLITLLGLHTLAMPVAETQDIDAAANNDVRVLTMSVEENNLRNEELGIVIRNANSSITALEPTREPGFEPSASSQNCALGCSVTVQMYTDLGCSANGVSYNVGDGGKYCWQTANNRNTLCVILVHDNSCDNPGKSNRVALYWQGSCSGPSFATVWEWQQNVHVYSEDGPWQTWNVLCQQ